MRGRLAGYNTPRVVRFATELPRNAVGKIQKHILRKSVDPSAGRGQEVTTR